MPTRLRMNVKSSKSPCTSPIAITSPWASVAGPAGVEKERQTQTSKKTRKLTRANKPLTDCPVILLSPLGSAHLSRAERNLEEMLGFVAGQVNRARRGAGVSQVWKCDRSGG